MATEPTIAQMIEAVEHVATWPGSLTDQLRAAADLLRQVERGDYVLLDEALNKMQQGLARDLLGKP
jgi:hypothetical protein